MPSGTHPAGSGLEPRPTDRAVLLARRFRRGGRRSRLVRRSVAAALFIAAGLAATAGRPAPPAGLDVVAVSSDLPTGATLHAQDLTVTRLTGPPDGAIHPSDRVAGRDLAGPVRRGEVLTDARLVPQSGPDPGPRRTAVPARVADSAAVRMLSVGAHVAVLAAGPEGSVGTLTRDAVVLAIPPPAAGENGALVLLGVLNADADRVAAGALTGSIAVRFIPDG